MPLLAAVGVCLLMLLRLKAGRLSRSSSSSSQQGNSCCWPLLQMQGLVPVLLLLLLAVGRRHQMVHSCSGRARRVQQGLRLPWTCLQALLLLWRLLGSRTGPLLAEQVTADKRGAAAGLAWRHKQSSSLAGVWVAR